MMFCTNCGKENKGDTTFCTECGSKTSNVQASILPFQPKGDGKRSCLICGKKGMFAKILVNGVCVDCQYLRNRQGEENRISSAIDVLNMQLSDMQKLYQTTVEKAKSDALAEISSKISEQERALTEIGTLVAGKNIECANLNEEVIKQQKQLESATRKVLKLKTLHKSILYAVDAYFKQNVFDSQIVLPEAQGEIEELLMPSVELHFHNMDVKQLRQKFTQNQKLIRETSLKYQDRYTTKANATIYKLMVIALEAELQNVLYNINYGKLDDAIANIKLITSKYLKIATDGNQSIAPTLVKFVGQIELLFIEAVKIEYEYYVKKEQIKEEQRAIREQMRQEAEEHRELERQRKKVEDEENKFKAEIFNVQQQMQSATEQNKITELQNRINSLMQQLQGVEQKKDDIIRLQNGKAGYVYIISNLGSFGDSVFKVGMTRRLEPLDRVRELGDASVPFPFDVHIPSTVSPALNCVLSSVCSPLTILMVMTVNFVHITINRTILKSRVYCPGYSVTVTSG